MELLGNFLEIGFPELLHSTKCSDNVAEEKERARQLIVPTKVRLLLAAMLTAVDELTAAQWY